MNQLLPLPLFSDLKRQTWISEVTRGSRVCVFQPVPGLLCLWVLSPPPLILWLSTVNISPTALPVSQPGWQDGQRSNGEHIRNCDSKRVAFDQGSFVTPHTLIYSGLADTQLLYCHRAGRNLGALFLTSSMAHC